MTEPEATWPAALRPAFILPYFGHFPATFPYWLAGCARNPQFTWLIYTDDHTPYDYPANVKIHYCTFAELREHFETQLGFATALTRPYKLCDFRPLYGYLFNKSLQGYTHWGYCDTDLLLGDLGRFLTPQLLTEREKISVLGHLSLVQNRPELNTLFQRCDYRSVLQDKRNRIFDEVRFAPNINSLLTGAGYRLERTIPYADIVAWHYAFALSVYRGGDRCSILPRQPLIFSYRDGRLCGHTLVDGRVQTQEYAYVHFQKRAVTCPEAQLADYLLVPNAIIPYAEVTPDLIQRYSQDHWQYNTQRWLERVRNAVKVHWGL